MRDQIAAKLTALSFTPSQIDKFILLASETTLTSLCDHYHELTALGFNNRHITELATQNDGAALNIILNRKKKFTELLNLGFTAANFAEIAGAQPHNLLLLLEYKSYLNFNEMLTVETFVKHLSGKQAEVGNLRQIIQNMLTSFISDEEQMLTPARNDTPDPLPDAKRRKVSYEKSEYVSTEDPLDLDKLLDSIINSDPSVILDLDPFMQDPSSLNLTSTAQLQRTLISPSVVLEPQLTIPEAPVPNSFSQTANNTSWFLSKQNVNDQRDKVTNNSPENLVYRHKIFRSQIARVIKPDQLAELKTDETGNTYIVEDGIKLIAYPNDSLRNKTPTDLFNELYFCVDYKGRLIGVVFNSDPSTFFPRFSDYEVISGKLLTRRSLKAKNNEHQQRLLKDIQIAQEICVIIVGNKNISNTPNLDI